MYLTDSTLSLQPYTLKSYLECSQRDSNQAQRKILLMLTEINCKTSLIQRPNISKIIPMLITFSSTVLLEKISNSWMFEEEILLLIKENRHKEAIKKYVDNGRYAKAEEFCVTKDKSLGLLTTLLTIYF